MLAVLVVILATTTVTRWWGLRHRGMHGGQVASYCRDGELAGLGSSIFSLPLAELARNYTQDCPGAHVSYEATGSSEGLRALDRTNPAESARKFVMAEGRLPPSRNPSTLEAHPVAVLILAVVVNTTTGVSNLSTEQLRHIYNGTYTDWSQLRGGPHLPIRIVGRSSTSASRQLFERLVLHADEREISSDDCVIRHVPVGGPIRCELGSSADALRKIYQTAGAIGYVDKPTIASASRTSGALNTKVVSIDGASPDSPGIRNKAYNFWTVEYAYTLGTPEPASAAAGFLDFLSSPRAVPALEHNQFLPCSTESMAPLCAEDGRTRGITDAGDL